MREGSMGSSNAAYESAYAALETGRRLPLDRVHLAKQSLGDQGIEQEILRLFGLMVRACLERVVTSTNPEALGAELHAMRLAAGGVGAWPLARRAGEAEDAIAAGKPVDPRWVEDIEASVAELLDYVDGLIEPDAGD
jgi:hypothetical protein